MSLRPLASSFFLMLACTWVQAQVSEQVEVTGAVQQRLRLDAAALAAFPTDAIGQITQARNPVGANPPSTVRGVKLAALIGRAGLTPTARNDWKATVVVVSATDGYRVVFSWPELTNTAVGDGVLVLFERDGKPLDEREGRIALISATDLRTGPRHVRNVAHIEVRSLN
ncbi:MAG TPA: sulfite oxidase-like oxidoreductase [Variovorax sp.]|nr:sulfite oxidase-like oxidoreductase [Variovorax sp.]